jgi:5-oxoprolinase (ATP-hydrolysing)
MMRILADRGGTFTDIVCIHDDGTIEVKKVLSDNPDQYDNALIEGIRLFKPLSDTHSVTEIRLGTTLATNALLERKGSPVIFITNAGFGSALRIGDQARPSLFSRHVPDRSHIHQDVLEIQGRLDAGGEEVLPLNETATRDALKTLKANTDCTTVAICLIHSVKNPKHELMVEQWAREAGFGHIYLSHQVAPQSGWWARASTTLLEAYLNPALASYVRSLRKDPSIDNVPLRLMQSHGGLADASDVRGTRSLLSGPAGGLFGAIEAARAAGLAKIITFDMGGTSADVARFDGRLDRRYHTMVDGMPLSVPTLAIDTIAAGGGSCLHITEGRFIVGPDSAGSQPGPACYRNGGPATLTDANVILGKIQPSFFPRIFGKNHNEGLDKDAAERALSTLILSSENTAIPKDLAAVAAGFVDVAVHAMARAIHKLSVARGFDVRQYALCAFGGAAGQHACLVAEALGIKKVLIHRLSSVLSAFGMGIAPESVLESRYLSVPLSQDSTKNLFDHYTTLAAVAENKLSLHLPPNSPIHSIATLQMHDQGSDTCLDIPYNPHDSLEDVKDAFHRQHRALFGAFDTDAILMLKGIVVEARHDPIPPELVQKKTLNQNLPPMNHHNLYSKGQWHRASLYELPSLNPGQNVAGPALLVDQDTNVVVEAGWVAVADETGGILLNDVRGQGHHDVYPPVTHADPAFLEIFHHLFSAVAEDMGETLAKTAHSVNIKERRDFSCAVFDAQGNLIANAPHVPVHLGSMGASVQAVLTSGLSMNPMDAFVTNDPYHGGTHLPDITVITPVFIEGTVRYFVASRGHHADVGGITPGSMPANSVHIDEEGVLIPPQKLVDQKTFQTDKMQALFSNARYPARNIPQNLADLRACVAANRAGVKAMRDIVDSYGPKTVDAYMGFILENAQNHVASVLHHQAPGSATITHDNGCIVTVKVTPDPATKRLRIDFSGTSPAGQHNLNAPLAITRACVLYVLRSLVSEDIPLNDGCLRAVDLVVPEGSLLNPPYPHAVSAGNVETSQMIVDALLLALGVQAASHGTMNNISFGNKIYQYYETLAGGGGAGPDFNGSTGYQCHMTNSRLTDVEILEQRFPVRVWELSVAENTGGAGEYCGGDGIRRDLEFLEPVDVSLITNNRQKAPKGFGGGKDGQSGVNIHQPAGKSTTILVGCCHLSVQTGDHIIIQTPGGGGWGTKD